MIEIYQWDEIKEAGDCVAWCKDQLGMTPKGTNKKGWVFFDNPWRPNSDSGAFHVTAKGYNDHVSSETGSIIDLVAMTQFNGNVFLAQQHLGKFFGLTPKMQAKKAQSIKRVYDYVDDLGVVRHQTVRFDPKGFAQRRPDPENAGKWIWNLEGIQPVLYRMADWRDSKWVCIVGGEKDADNLLKMKIPATTNPMGEGSWRDDYSKRFAGKSVVILPDNDDAGAAHAATVSRSLSGVAKAVKIVNLPGLPPKGDVSDFIELGKTRQDILDEIKAQKNLTNIKPTSKNKKSNELSLAKQANKYPFSNFTTVPFVTSTGKEREVKEPVPVSVLIRDVFRRFWDFPRRVGGTMFDHDRKTKEVRFFYSAAEINAWIGEKSAHIVRWGKSEGCVSPSELFASLSANCTRYEMISGVPNWPERNDVYYTHSDLPEPTSDGRFLKQFCSFFCPETEQDAALIRAFVASPLYFKHKVPRPLWIIDSPNGQGTGKTKFVELVTNLYGGDDFDCGEPLWVDYKQVNNEAMLDRIIKRLLSLAGRKKRVFCMDNIEGYFQSSALSTLITQGSITGIPPYGHGEETRPNDLTYVLTSNSATISRDLASRAFFIHVVKPVKADVNWERKVMDFTSAHRLQVIADIIHILKQGPQYVFAPLSRYPPWEHDVLVPMLGDMDTYSEVFKVNELRRQQSDGEMEEAESLREFFSAKIKELGFDPEETPIWLQSSVVSFWASEAIAGFGGRSGRNAVHKIRNMIKNDLLPELSLRLQKFPHRGGNVTPSRGIFWKIELYDCGKKPCVIYKSASDEVSFRETS